jgi:hypothetical protein
VREEATDSVSVHGVLTLGGYGACFVAALFCVVLVLLPPGPITEQGALRYISEGMETYCGWSAVVLGSCSLLLLLCHVVAAVHIAEHTLSWAFMQALGWNVVLGVVDTGWTAHYVGLCFFLLGGTLYHRAASCDQSYGGPTYRVVNKLSLVLAMGFCLMVVMTKLSPHIQLLRSVAVSLEFLLMGTLLVQSVFLIMGLDRFDDIHLHFSDRDPTPTPPPTTTTPTTAIGLW